MTAGRAELGGEEDLVPGMLFEGKPCGRAVRDLMERTAKDETVG